MVSNTMDLSVAMEKFTAGFKQGGTCASMPESKISSVIVHHDGNIYVFGGGYRGLSYTCAVYDVEGNTWTSLHPSKKASVALLLSLLREIFT